MSARVEQLIADLWSGFQILTRSPGVSVTAIALIALVIGGNATIFSAVHSLLTKPAPAIAARGLVSLGWSVDRQAVHPTDSYANYLDLAEQARTVRPLLAFEFQRFTLTYRDGSYAVHGGVVTPNYFDTLRLTLARGRAFTEEDARGSALTAVIISSRTSRLVNRESSRDAHASRPPSSSCNSPLPCCCSPAQDSRIDRCPSSKRSISDSTRPECCS